MKKVLTVIGARPQFVKAAVVSREIKKSNLLEEYIVHTGQHFDANMSDIFFEEMSIPKPDKNLDVNGVGHGAMTGRMLEGLEQSMLEQKPDIVLVYGDTNSTLAGAIAAKKLHIPIAHVEAGLRSFNNKMPEEINRIVTDRISDILFCPTDNAIANLKNEGFDNIEAKVYNVGDVMNDAAIFYAKMSKQKSDIIDTNDLKANDFILCTIHRQENTDDENKLKHIISALEKIHQNNKRVIMPLHPRTAHKLKALHISPSFGTIPPVGYFDMIELLKNCSLVMTDSGGLQKEASFFEKPCITIRDQTEWVELINAGYNILSDAEINSICERYTLMSNKSIDFSQKLYGNGNAGNIIVKEIGQYLL